MLLTVGRLDLSTLVNGTFRLWRCLHHRALSLSGIFAVLKIFWSCLHNSLVLILPGHTAYRIACTTPGMFLQALHQSGKKIWFLLDRGLTGFIRLFSSSPSSSWHKHSCKLSCDLVHHLMSMLRNRLNGPALRPVLGKVDLSRRKSSRSWTSSVLRQASTKKAKKEMVVIFIWIMTAYLLGHLPVPRPAKQGAASSQHALKAALLISLLFPASGPTRLKGTMAAQNTPSWNYCTACCWKQHMSWLLCNTLSTLTGSYAIQTGNVFAPLWYTQQLHWPKWDAQPI